MIEEQTINKIFKKMLNVNVEEGLDYHRTYDTKTLNHVVISIDLRPGYLERAIQKVILVSKGNTDYDEMKKINQGFEGWMFNKFIIDDDKDHLFERGKKVFGDRWDFVEYEEVKVDGKTWYTLGD